MDGKLIFERDMALLADGYTQTLNRVCSICTCHIAIRATSELRLLFTAI
jgi:hypothetical protein